MQVFIQFFKSKDFKFTVALAVLGLFVLLISWFGINQTTRLILERESSDQVDRWITFISENISGFDRIISNGEITGDDLTLFQVASKAGGVLQFNLFDQKGIVIASSDQELVGKVYDKPAFLEEVKKGNKHIELTFELREDGSEVLIGEAYAPLTRNGSFIGAVEIYLDFSSELLFFQRIRNTIFMVTAGILILLGAIVNLLFFLHWLELTQTTRDLGESEEKFRNMAEGSIQGIIIERAGESLFANDSFARIFGYKSSEEILALDGLETLAPGEENEKLAKFYLALLRGEPVLDHFQAKGLQKDGTSIWLDTNLSKIVWDGEPAILRTVVDITRRKQAEEEILRLATAVEQAAENIFITDDQGKIQYVNPAFEATTGYRKLEVIGKKPNILNSGQMDESYFRNMWETLRRGEVWVAHHINRKKDGSLYHVEATNSPIRNEAGDITGFISVQRDVTSQLEMENQLRQSQKMEAIGSLAGGIAHDFNNLLTPIIGFTELTLESIKPDSENYGFLKEVWTAASRARDIVSQILLFTRKSEPGQQIIQVQSVAGEVVGLMRSTLPKNITIVERIDDDVASVKGDLGEIHQILMNLCINAGNAMQNGGELLVSIGNVSIKGLTGITGKKIAGDFVKLSVKDTGSGMSEDTKTHIFEKFFTTKKPGQGTGLGLATVHSIVEKQGWIIDVQSELGEGTTFEVYLPALLPLEDDKPEFERPATGGSESILVVDDESSIGTMIKSVLEKVGYKVTAVTDSQIALELFEIQPNRYDLVIVDQMMPNLNGEQLFAELRKLRKEVPVILYSGFITDFSVKKVEESGFSALLVKPVGSEDLRRTIRSVLDKASESSSG